MGQKKLIRFQAIKSFPNVLEFPSNMGGNWHDFFKNNHPITLELACGKGEYAVGLGRLYPQRNFIGIDIKGNRIWRGAKTAVDDGLQNVAFIRSFMDKITDYFLPSEIEEIWITFPDPQLRGSRSKKRLTHPRFLRLYQQVLKPGGLVHLKTDSPVLYHFTLTVINLFQLELLSSIEDMHAADTVVPELNIKTHYEGLDIAKSNRIHYICFRINQELSLEKDTLLKNIFREQTAD
ncbi:MAG: tRNA (guanosine(46)-N7)-methyltransferase TrmB [Sphingobacteriia bacterium]|nr:MAG: tRNA (guanosine(46)-N7)-methyltransferase TrmB [Sphingobacteriia bacterium]TAG30848.1 MAG: tRNA (guanosine(46)-N7)-methyltransferase TrmB [Sphingobacteriia bacterium]